MSAAESLNTNTNGFNNMPNNELVLNVSKLITGLVTKVDRKINDNKKIGERNGLYEKSIQCRIFFDSAWEYIRQKGSV